MLLALVLGGGVLFVTAYKTYGSYLDRLFGLAKIDVTPAHTHRDDQDYQPTARAVVLGHHFSSIAGAGPIVGPIFATLVFGWLPAVLWIVLGAIFVGGVHDFGSLALSLRHAGRSIADVSTEYVSPLARRLLLIFIWVALLYVLTVFVDLTATAFAPRGVSVSGVRQTLGGGVASASMLFILLALAMGLSLRSGRLSNLSGALIFVPMLFAATYWSQSHPLLLPVSLTAQLSATTLWIIALLVYCGLASVTPVWLLLQPRDFLSSFLLYASLLGGVLGIAAGTITDPAALSINYPAFLGFSSDKLGFLFPALFITIACGACSGFHSVIASGTTAKQIDQARDARPVGYGAMLIEGLLALVSVCTVAVMTSDGHDNALAPPTLFANGLSRFLAMLGVDPDIGRSFGLLALSTFLLTTLDTATRVSRYVLEELFSLDRMRYRHALATLPTLSITALLTLMPHRDQAGALVPTWRVIWPVFGATNQLLGGLALMVVSLWLRRTGKQTWPALLPMGFMLSATTFALLRLALRHGASLLGYVSTVLLLLALVLVIEAGRAWVRSAAQHRR